MLTFVLASAIAHPRIYSVDLFASRLHIAVYSCSLAHAQCNTKLDYLFSARMPRGFEGATPIGLRVTKRLGLISFSNPNGYALLDMRHRRIVSSEVGVQCNTQAFLGDELVLISTVSETPEKERSRILDVNTGTVQALGGPADLCFASSGNHYVALFRYTKQKLTLRIYDLELKAFVSASSFPDFNKTIDLVKARVSRFRAVPVDVSLLENNSFLYREGRVDSVNDDFVFRNEIGDDQIVFYTLSGEDSWTKTCGLFSRSKVAIEGSGKAILGQALPRGIYLYVISAATGHIDSYKIPNTLTRHLHAFLFAS